MTITQLYIYIYYKSVHLLQTTILLCVELKCVIENISLDRLHQYFMNFECKIQNGEKKITKILLNFKNHLLKLEYFIWTWAYNMFI